MNKIINHNLGDLLEKRELTEDDYFERRKWKRWMKKN